MGETGERVLALGARVRRRLTGGEGTPKPGARVRRRLARGERTSADLDAELRWWRDEWDPAIRAGGLGPEAGRGELRDGAGGAPAGEPGRSGGEPVAATYEGRRWQIARAEVRRALAEGGVDAPAYFTGRVVVDLAPGPLGFPDACGARVAIGIEPLAERLGEHGLLLADGPAIYLALPPERLPLVSGSADVVLLRHALERVADPAGVVGEATRVLRRGGEMVLAAAVDRPPGVAGPHALTLDQVRGLVAHLEPLHERVEDHPDGRGGHAVALRRRLG